MAYTTILLIVSTVVVASAGFPGWMDDDDSFPGFNTPVMSMRFGSFPTPPKFPSFPPMPTPASMLFFHQFPTFPPITFPPMPSIQDIANAKPGEGGTVNAVVITTKSEMTKDDQGNIIKKGGSTIMTNNDGKVTVQKSGNAPPELKSAAPHFDRDFVKIKPLKHKFKNHRTFDFPKHFDDFPSIPALDPQTLKDYKPGKNEKFRGHSIQSHSYYTNNNGDVKHGGGIVKIDNINGKVNEENLAFHS